MLVYDSQEQKVAETPQDESRFNLVKEWQKRIDMAKVKWTPDYDRMRKNMRFVTGRQWEGQTDIQYHKYVANLTLRAINIKVAMLYARNPRVSVRKTDRMEYRFWDGKMESIWQAIDDAHLALEQIGYIPPSVQQILTDFEEGTARKALYSAVGETLKRVMQFQLNTQDPEFKTQAKQLVRRICVCGVGYVRVNFERTFDARLHQSSGGTSVLDRVRRLRMLVNGANEGKLEETDAELTELEVLLKGMETAHLELETGAPKERLVFDFPPATAIIPDPNCRSLNGFIGAQWVAEEFVLPLSFVNEFFEVKISSSSVNKDFNVAQVNAWLSERGEPDPLCVVREVFDKRTRTRFVICDGYNDFLEAPESVLPSTSNFWPIYAVTFNDVETDSIAECSPFPPSDVDLVMHAQKEWNRTREALRKQRRSNSPKYITPSGVLPDEDLEAIVSAEDNEILQLKGVAPGQDIKNYIQPLGVRPIDPALYETGPLEQDIMYATGLQQANLGPAQPDVTATVGTIAEQSRMSVSASNVDDLDDALSAISQAGGQMLLMEMSPEVVKSIVGPGAVWPVQDKEQYANEVLLEIEAASSGRPNKAIEVANWERLAPVLQASGANPHAIVRETVKRLDDRLDPQEFFPVNPGGGGMGGPVTGVPPAQTPEQPLQKLPNGSAIPLVGA